jgi:hypothetical protein
MPDSPAFLHLNNLMNVERDAPCTSILVEKSYKCRVKSKSNTNSKPPQCGIGILASGQCTVGHGLVQHCPALAVHTVGDDDLIKCPGLWVKKVLRSREIVYTASKRNCRRGMDKKQSLKLHERKQNLFLSPVLLCENGFGHGLDHNHEIVG